MAVLCCDFLARLVTARYIANQLSWRLEHYSLGDLIDSLKIIVCACRIHGISLRIRVTDMLKLSGVENRQKHTLTAQ